MYTLNNMYPVSRCTHGNVNSHLNMHILGLIDGACFPVSILIRRNVATGLTKVQIYRGVCVYVKFQGKRERA